MAQRYSPTPDERRALEAAGRGSGRRAADARRQSSAAGAAGSRRAPAAARRRQGAPARQRHAAARARRPRHLRADRRDAAHRHRPHVERSRVPARGNRGRLPRADGGVPRRPTAAAWTSSPSTIRARRPTRPRSSSRCSRRRPTPRWATTAPALVNLLASQTRLLAGLVRHAGHPRAGDRDAGDSSDRAHLSDRVRAYQQYLDRRGPRARRARQVHVRAGARRERAPARRRGRPLPDRGLDAPARRRARSSSGSTGFRSSTKRARRSRT